MVRRRLYRGIRGSIGVELYKFPSTVTGGVPRPFFSVATGGSSVALSLTTVFEQSLHASVNNIQYYQNFNNPWPTTNINAITATGRSQMMTLEPVTASFNVAGGIRTSDGVVDNPMISGTSYSGFVITGSLLAAHVTQPNGTYVVLGGASGGPGGIQLTMDVPYTVTSGTHITTTPFTPTKNYVTALIFDLVGITAGNYDSVIQTFASSAVGNNLILRFAHEMNGNWYPWGVYPTSTYTYSASQYVALWNHVRAVWRAQETSISAPNVPWVWCPNIANNRTGVVADSGVLSTGPTNGSGFPIYAPATVGAVGTGNSTYPGDANCEYIGLDGYSNPSSVAGANAPFAALFAADIQWMQTSVTTTKPFIICETGTDVSIGSTARAAWFSGMFDTMHTYSVIGVSYFNNTGSGNYPINTDPIACQGFLSSLKQWVRQYP
ncbi:MAG: beta-mannanase-like protein [Candidatus Saccharibacteria bacterium]|nr:beta-mannanase-like protein [Candidatus Saccharibacteria bacterium]